MAFVVVDLEKRMKFSAENLFVFEDEAAIFIEIGEARPLDEEVNTNEME